MKHKSHGQVKIKLELPNFYTEPPDGQLSFEEGRILEGAKESATSNLSVFIKLLESAQLEHDESLSQRLLKILHFVIGRRRTVLIHVLDPKSGTKFDMKFSLPLRLFHLLVETPIVEVLESNPTQLASQTRIPEILLKRLIDDVRVFKIVFVYKGEFSPSTCLIDFMQ